MPFLIKTVKRRPNGSESIRERRIEKDTISIGRGSNNDIVISDLSLALNHAKITQSEQNELRLILPPQQSALLNGKLVTGKNIAISPQAEIKIGHTHFSYEKSAEQSLCTLRLEQEPSTASDSKKNLDPEIFNLTNVLPSKRLMAWVFSIFILAFFLALPIMEAQKPNTQAFKNFPMQADLSWNSGEISLMHSNLKSDCTSCHAKPFVSVRDAACANCHKGTKNHAKLEDLRISKPTQSKFTSTLNQISEVFGRRVDRCASCHAEHNKKELLIPNEQEFCVACHTQLNQKLPQTKLSNVSDFGVNHPQFRPRFITTPDKTDPILSHLSLDKNPKGYSGLKFSHKQHMEKGKAVDRMASKLPKNDGFGDGVNCADCHRPETGGGLFQPVNMVQDCAMCHTLGFEKTKLGKNTDYLRTLRHGEPEEVIATMRDFYLAKTLANLRDVEKNSTTRRRPGRAAQLRNLNARELAFKQADSLTATRVKTIFSKGGACFDCHVIQKPTKQGSLDYRVEPISIDSQFYPQSQFRHATHEMENLDCASCHKAKESTVSSDILLPKIEICRDCHIGEESYRTGGIFAKGKIPTTCLTCHSYHDGKHATVMVQNTKIKEVEAEPSFKQ